MIFMTRPPDFEESFRNALGDGVKVLNCPLLDVLPIGSEQIVATGYDTLIFTSRMAVKHSEDRIADRNVMCVAVGPGTADDLRQSGFSPVLNAGGTADHLVRFLRQTEYNRALYISGKNVTVDLSKQFPDRVDRFVVYETVPVLSLPRSVSHHLKSGKPWIAPFFSKKSYQSFEQLVRRAKLQSSCRHGHVIAISQSVADVFAMPWSSHTVVESPDASSMYAAMRAAA